MAPAKRTSKWRALVGKLKDFLRKPVTIHLAIAGVRIVWKVARWFFGDDN